MQRIFIKDVGNHKAGKIADYPMGVWRHIASSSFYDLDDITKPVEEAARNGSEMTNESDEVSIARQDQPSGIKRGRGRPRKMPVGT